MDTRRLVTGTMQVMVTVKPVIICEFYVSFSQEQSERTGSTYSSQLLNRDSFRMTEGALF